MMLSNSTRIWLHGLGAAFIGAFAASASGLFSLPTVFNFTHDGLINMVKMSVGPAAFAVFTYLKQSPLPPLQTQVNKEEKIVGPDGEITQKSTSTTITQGTTPSAKPSDQ